MSIDIDKKEKHDLMITNKTPLKNICKNNELIAIINNNVYTINKIVIQTYQFLNLYLIDKYNRKENFPELDDIFIKAIFDTITTRQTTSGKPPSETTKEILDELKNFYNNQYERCINNDDVQDRTKLNFSLAYEAISIITNINNNITEHFIDYVNKFVNISLGLNNLIKSINDNKQIDKNEKKNQRDKIYGEFRQIKKDIVKLTNEFESDKKYHEWINKHKKYIIRKDSFKKNDLNYDLVCNPQDYLKSLYYMNNELELLNNIIKEENIEIAKKNENMPKNKKIKSKPEIKLFHVIPQRTSIKPKYITIDTSALINLVMTKNVLKYLSDISKYKVEIWGNNFNMSKEFKRKGYKFNYTITTDGVGCSVLLIKLGKNGEPVKITHGMQKKIKKLKELEDKYIENVTITKEMRKKRIVTIDPNMSDIIYCVSKTIPCKRETLDENDKVIKVKYQDEIITFRYTQNQRRLETRNKKYAKIRDKLSKKTKINKKSVKELESELSEYNSKSVNYNDFMKYCIKKNEINRKLFEYYSQNIFRKLKFNIYINTQKSEKKMIRNFSNKYGKPEKTLVIIGDYDKGANNMRGKEPIINRKIRKIFKNNKYETYKINEFRTSKLCHICCGENETFIKRESKKPKDEGKKIEVFGLLRCTNVNCKQIHNRDKNAALNMYKIVKSIFEGKGRPKEYCRQQ